jgi:hypothetical protein
VAGLAILVIPLMDLGVFYWWMMDGWMTAKNVLIYS